MAKNLCVGSRWPNPVRGRTGGAGMRCKSGKTGKFIPNRNCNRCPSSLGLVRTRKRGSSGYAVKDARALAYFPKGGGAKAMSGMRRRRSRKHR